MEKPTLQEQIEEAKNTARAEYAERLIRVMDGETSPYIAREIFNPSVFIKRDSKHLYVEIVNSYVNGEPINARYVRKPERVPALAHLAAWIWSKLKSSRFYISSGEKSLSLKGRIGIWGKIKSLKIRSQMEDNYGCIQHNL